MPIRIARGAGTRICDHSDGFAVQVLHPSDLGAAMDGVRLARADLLAMVGRREPRDGSPRASVSPVVAAPGGPLFVADHVELSYETLRGIPDLVARRLEQAGVEFATVTAPERGGVLDGIDTTRNAVVLRIFPSPRRDAGVIPPGWLDVAADWVLGDSTENVCLRVLGVEYAVDGVEASTVLHECGLTRTWCDIVQGDLADRIRMASVTFGRLPHVALAAGGPAVDSAGLVARFDLLVDVARELPAGVAYACIDFEDTFEGLALGLSPDGWRRQGGAPPNVVAGELVDEFVPDSFPYQVLGPGHLARYREQADLTDLADTAPLDHGRTEVAIGAPNEWLPRAGGRYELQESGWEVLGPCLVPDGDLADLVDRREAGAAPTVDIDVTGHVPDLANVVLDGHPHPRRGTRLSILELAAWLGHEAHRDDPATVSSPLATFLRWWAAGLDDRTRQRLKPYAPALVGTGDEPARDGLRRWAAVDWLVRAQAPAWLRLAGLTEAADRLVTVGSLQENLELVRAVDILGSAITVASRRADITAAMDDEGDANQVAWEAWERVSERAAWGAASEAATQGAPAELTYATDLRVIECSRDERVRDEIEAAHVSVGDATWVTALHAISDEAWERAWRAADAGSRELSTVGLRDQVRRVTAAVAKRNARDDVEAALELAEHAARDELTRAALRGGAPLGDEHPWDGARNAARSSHGGTVWAMVMEDARRGIGEDAWAQAMADARAAIDEVLHDAPNLVGRSVAAALAREAASAAARTVAARAVAVARANGAGDDEAFDAAVASLAVTADQLTESAFSLLDALIDPSAPPSLDLSAVPSEASPAPLSPARGG